MERRVREWRTARAEQLMEGMRSAGKGANRGQADSCRDTNWW